MHFIIKAYQRNFVHFIGFYFKIFFCILFLKYMKHFLFKKHPCICSDIFQQKYFNTHFLFFYVHHFQNEYIFEYSLMNFSIAKPPVSSLILPTTNLFE